MTNDLTHSGVPYHDYRTFCMKVVFPNASDEEKYMMLHNIDIPVSHAAAQRSESIGRADPILEKTIDEEDTRPLGTRAL